MNFQRPVKLAVSWILLTAGGLIICSSVIQAQRQSHFWYFGQNCGIDFNQQPPVAITNSGLISLEGSAAYADPVSGDLLFYTDGLRVWDRDNTLMPSSSDWLPADIKLWPNTASTTQGALVVPHPANGDLFYIFNPGNMTNPQPAGDKELRLHRELSYSLIDMRQAEGRGAIVAHQALTPGRIMTERLCGTAVCDNQTVEYWVLSQDNTSKDIFAFRVARDGVSETAIVSPIGPEFRSIGGGVGQMKLSPNGRLGATVLQFLSQRGPAIGLFRFNPDDGRISSPFIVEMPETSQFYGLSFSPDNSRLYVSTLGGNLYQFSLSSFDAAAVSASAVLVASNADEAFGQLQIAPDRRIYMARMQSDRLYVINFPNRPGLACDFQEHSLTVGADELRQIRLGLPNTMDFIFGEQAGPCPTLKADMSVESICEGSCAEFKDRSTPEPREWRWQFEGGRPAVWDGPEPPPICYDEAGSFAVSLEVRNESGRATTTQSIEVLPRPSLSTGGKQRICEGASVELSVSGGERYEWNPAESLSDAKSANPVAAPEETTLYTVRGWNAAGCVSSATVLVEVRPWAGLRLSLPDTTVTPGEEILLPVNMDVPEAYLPVRIERLRFDLRYGAQILAARGAEGAGVQARRLEGESELLTVEGRDLVIQESPGPVLWLRVIGLISLTSSTEIVFENLEVDFAPVSCLTVEEEGGSVGIHDYCLAYGISFAPRLQIQLQPNPTRDDVQIAVQGTRAGIVRMRLVNSLGRSIVKLIEQAGEGETRNFDFATEELPAGIYFLLVENGGQVRREQLLINR